MKKLLLLSISALFILACHSGSKEVTTTQVKLQSVTLGLMPTMDGFPFIVAHRQGIYDSLGLEVNLVRFNSANDRDAAFSKDPEAAVAPFVEAAKVARKLGIGLNAGHDLSLVNLNFFYKNIPWLDEVSIGHALISDALYLGLERTIQEYKNCLR